MKNNNFGKILLALPVVAVSFAANAEIAIDAQNNISYSSGSSALAINSDGNILIGGEVVGNCAGAAETKVSKVKTGTVTCDSSYTKVKDKSGVELARFSGFARATDAKGNVEKKLFDPNMATIGSASTGAAALTQTQSTVVQTVETKNVITAPDPAVPVPQPAPVDERLHTPKLGTEAYKTPAILKERTPDEVKADRAINRAEKAARNYNPATVPTTTTVITTEAPAAVKTTETVTTVKEPVPSAATPPSATTVQKTTEVVPTTSGEAQVNTQTTIVPAQ